jgi:SAM-dependent methyltransferase
METVACPFCPDAASEPALEDNGYTGRRCASCGLVFVSPRPTAAEVEALYREDHAYLPAASHLEAANLATRLYNRRSVGLLRRHAPGRRLLELGAGGGGVLAAARDAGFDVHATELSPIQAAHIRDRLGIPCAESTERVAAESGPGSFDVIYHRNVLSHFPDPLGELTRLHDLLRPGGRLVFETGNFGDVDPERLRSFRTLQFPDHLFLFGDRSLDLLLERTGFRRLRTYRYSLEPRVRVAALARAALGGGGGAGGAGSAAARLSTGGRARRLALVLFELVQYAMTYWAGAVVPKRGRPQTTVVVAERR